jgi:hypothetical protein
MKETFYFSHDYGARYDEKIIELLRKEGWAGYGIFWAIIEKLYEANGFLAKDYDSIAFDLRTDSERIKAVVESGLFQFSNDKFYSKSVNARLVARKGKSEMARQSAFFRWNKPKKEHANALRTDSERYASKVKESKVNKSKDITNVIEETSEIEKVKYGNEDINWLIQEFETVMSFKSQGGKKDRFMAKHLLNNYSKEQLTYMLNWCASDTYAPRIGSIEKLWYKRADVVAGIKKKIDNPSIVIINE